MQCLQQLQYLVSILEHERTRARRSQQTGLSLRYKQVSILEHERTRARRYCSRFVRQIFEFQSSSTSEPVPDAEAGIPMVLIQEFQSSSTSEPVPDSYCHGMGIVQLVSILEHERTRARHP